MDTSTLSTTFQQRVQAARAEAGTYPADVRPFMDQFLMNRAFIEPGDTTGWAYPTYQDLLLDVGELRQQPFFVPDDDLFLLDEAQQCYYNSWRACMELEGYTYVEGHAQTNLLVVPHAWVEDPEGRIVDSTWANHVEADEHVVPTYYGIRFDTEFVLRRASESGWCSILHREWSYTPDFPALRFGFVTNDAGLVIDYRPKEAHS